MPFGHVRCCARVRPEDQRLTDPGPTATTVRAELRHAIPQVYAGYKELHDSALAPGVLDIKTKELIALAIAVSKECDGCIAAHAHAAVQYGATPQEAAEAIGVTFLMNGGPATVYGARAFATFQEFHSERIRMSQLSGSVG